MIRLTFWTVSLGSGGEWGEENLGTVPRAYKTNPFFHLDCKPLSPCQRTKDPDSHKTKSQGFYRSLRPDHRVKLLYFKHVWMLLAHQGERTVTGLAELITNHYVRQSSMWNRPSRRHRQRSCQAVKTTQKWKDRLQTGKDSKIPTKYWNFSPLADLWTCEVSHFDFLCCRG